MRNTTPDSQLCVNLDTPKKWLLQGKPEMPSAGQLAKNAAGSFTRNLASVMQGNPINADPDVIEQRKRICSQCEYMHNNRCGKCGCWLQYKAALRAEKCPINKWE